MIYERNLSFRTNESCLEELIRNLIPNRDILWQFHDNTEGNKHICTWILGFPQNKKYKGICFLRIEKDSDEKEIAGRIYISADKYARNFYDSLFKNLDVLAKNELLKYSRGGGIIETITL